MDPSQSRKGSNQVEHTLLRCNEWMIEWKTNTSPQKPGIIFLSCEDNPAGTLVLLCLHCLGRVVKWLHPHAELFRLGGGTASEQSPSHTWTWHDLRGVGVDQRAPAGGVVRWGSATAVLYFQSAGCWAEENKTSFNSTLAGGWSYKSSARHQ